MRPASIVLVTPWIQSGGIERTIAVKAPWLAARGHRVELVAWHVAETLGGAANPTLHALGAAGIPVRRLARAGRAELLRHAATVARRILGRPDTVLVGHELLANVVVLLAKILAGGRPRTIAQVHNEPATYATTGATPRLLALARCLYRYADGTVAVSEHLRRAHIEAFRVRPARVVTIHNPFDIERIASAARAPVPEPDGPPWLVACGRLTAVKGFDDLIRAFALVRRTRPLRLVILGDGPDREALARLAASEGVGEDVRLPGFVAAPYAWFGGARCFVLSSRSEGLANVLLEAMAAGTPIVSSRCGGAEEVIDHDRTGLLYPPGDVPALACALARVLDHPEQARVRASQARQRVNEFGEGRVLPRLERYYVGIDAGAVAATDVTNTSGMLQP